MTFEVEMRGRSRTVGVDRSDEISGRFRITVDGRAHVVDAARVGEFGLSMIVEASAAAVYVTPGAGPAEMLVLIGGRTIGVTVNGRRSRRSAESGAHAAGEQSIVAPMPGRVVRVLVSTGDEVEARQGIIVVEAMKMENELRAPKAGRVKDVSVTPGTSVEAGRVLAVIE